MMEQTADDMLRKHMVDKQVAQEERKTCENKRVNEVVQSIMKDQSNDPTRLTEIEKARREQNDNWKGVPPDLRGRTKQVKDPEVLRNNGLLVSKMVSLQMELATITTTDVFPNKRDPTWLNRRKINNALYRKKVVDDHEFCESGYYEKLSKEVEAIRLKSIKETLQNADKMRAEADRAEEERLDMEEKKEKQEKAQKVQELAEKRKKKRP